MTAVGAENASGPAVTEAFAAETRTQTKEAPLLSFATPGAPTSLLAFTTADAAGSSTEADSHDEAPLSSELLLPASLDTDSTASVPVAPATASAVPAPPRILGGTAALPGAAAGTASVASPSSSRARQPAAGSSQRLLYRQTLGASGTSPSASSVRPPEIPSMPLARPSGASTETLPTAPSTATSSNAALVAALELLGDSRIASPSRSRLPPAVDPLAALSEPDF